MQAAKTLMSGDVTCIDKLNSVQTVCRLMSENAHSCVIVGNGRHAEGIITERDIVSLLAKAPAPFVNLAQLKAAEIMSTELVSVLPDADIFDALVLSLSRKIRHILVIDEQQQLQGLITYSDLVRTQRRWLEQQRGFPSEPYSRQVDQLNAQLSKADDLSLEDPVTQLGNRRAMEVDLRYSFEASEKYQHDCVVVLLVLEGFAQCRQQYGQAAADAVVKTLAKTIQIHLRQPDRVYRYDAGSFLMILPHAASTVAALLIQRLSAVLEAKALNFGQAASQVVLSVGRASRLAQVAQTYQALIDHAEQTRLQIGLVEASAKQATCLKEN